MRLITNLTVKALGLVVMVSAMSTVAMADFDVPEIDPGSIASAVTLLSAGLMMFTARRRAAK